MGRWSKELEFVWRYGISLYLIRVEFGKGAEKDEHISFLYRLETS